VDEAERDRVATLELMDELEEWELLAKHYLITWGWRGSSAHFKRWIEMCPGQMPYPEVSNAGQSAIVEVEKNNEVQMEDVQWR
jgi:hypothetical protein